MTVCDAGGGTVDLISYKILKLRPLEVVELVPGTCKNVLESLASMLMRPKLALQAP